MRHRRGPPAPSEILPCPFCGSRLEVISVPGADYYQHPNVPCIIRNHEVETDIVDVRRWNTRAIETLKPVTVSVTEACRLSGLGATTVWNTIKAGKLDVARVGSRTLVFYASLKAFLEARATRGRARPADGYE